MRRSHGHGGRLARALVEDAAQYGLTLTLVAAAERPWASATFIGERHRLRVMLADADPAAWLASLAEEELLVPGCLVADIAVDRADGGSADLTVLLVDPA